MRLHTSVKIFQLYNIDYLYTRYIMITYIHIHKQETVAKLENKDCM